jgi:hypothetical protein
MSRAAIALAGVLLIAAAGAAGYWRGHASGQAAELARQNAATVEAVRQQLQTHADLVKRSGAASRDMRAAVARLEQTNAITTSELADVLQLTAADRADCRFPADVMRGLSEARDRAADAAAGGIRRALPGAASGPARPASGPGGP